MSYGRVAAVTGANKGIGLAIVRQLALRYPTSPSANGPFLIYLLSRSATRGQSALSSLLSDPALLSARALASAGGPTTIKLHELDISDPDSIRAFAATVRREHPDGLDVLVNNAGVALDGFNSKVVEGTMRCNYYATVEMMRTFLPLMRKRKEGEASAGRGGGGGRIINVASVAGMLGKMYSADVKARFLQAGTVGEVDELMAEFARLVAEGTQDRHGWPTGAAYSVSKAGLIAATRIISRQEYDGKSGVVVSACCPGWVVTDMTKGRGHKNVDEGARTPVMLALDDVGDAPALFWRDEEAVEWR